MIIAGIYSFNEGEQIISEQFPEEYNEVMTVINNVNALNCKNKESKEKTKSGQILYSPKSLNYSFKHEFTKYNWGKKRVICEYKQEYYTHQNNTTYHQTYQQKPFREMDFVKNYLGVEVQFGKYAFMVYNVCAKMTIFKNKKIINAGIEIVPIKEFAVQMSTGVSYFEQIVWDLENRGVSNIDTPVLVLGVMT
jgi:hypothetical protein